MTLVEVDDPGILHDADTPEDYRELLRMHNSQLTRPVVQVSICREKRFLDPRVAMLLTLTDETQSVRAACQRMQLSYSSGLERHKPAGGRAGLSRGRAHPGRAARRAEQPHGEGPGPAPGLRGLYPAPARHG